MQLSCGWRHLHRPFYGVWLAGESLVGRGVAWFALCFAGGLLGSLSRLVQFLPGLRFATLAGIALPGCGLCMAQSVAYVGFHYRPRVLLPVWRLPFRLWPILVLFLLAGVTLWHKLGKLYPLKLFRCPACPCAANASFVTACGAWLLPTWELHLRFVQRWFALMASASYGTLTLLVDFVQHPSRDLSV
ncbi:hypothetical protein V6N12_065675 [Hibiscus sabdariffa]|uniref:Uncharacterized protein n=1 Tax=Hibiscus sabdariffa TaxID=183260 RepID=A0ABR2GAE2_9ROSI